jgi:outer membrane lipoprotein SlyB
MNYRILPIMLGIFITTSCVNNSLQPDVVSRSDAQKQQYVVFGTITDVTKVTIEGDREVGSAAGLVIGGAVGKDSTDSDLGSDIAAVVGGLIGSAIGSEVGSAVTRKEGVELLIETDSGNFVSIIQEVSDFTYVQGQKVRIIKRNGKSRVIPFE